MSVDVCGLWMERAYVRAGGGTRLSGLHSLRGRVPEAERAPPPHMRHATKQRLPSKKNENKTGTRTAKRSGMIAAIRLYLGVRFVRLFVEYTRLSLDLFRVLDAHFQRFPRRATRGRGPVRRYSRNL
jgi:hypothetical protein